MIVFAVLVNVVSAEAQDLVIGFQVSLGLTDSVTIRKSDRLE